MDGVDGDGATLNIQPEGSPTEVQARLYPIQPPDATPLSAKLDKTEALYLERVRSLLAGGEFDRRTLRRRKAGQEASGREERLNLEQVLVAARQYYAKVTGVKQKRPWKITGHADFNPPMGRHFQCLWHDVGYAGQDYSEWMPPDFCLQFEGLVEDYRNVCDTTLHHWTD